MTGNNQSTGRVVGVNGNMVSVRFEGNVSMNEICYVKVGNTSLKSEVIRKKRSDPYPGNDCPDTGL